MINIRPSSDLRNNYSEISQLCKESGEPVYITVNGKGDLAIMDLKKYDELMLRMEIVEKVLLAEKDFEDGRTLTHEQVFGKYRQKWQGEITVLYLLLYGLGRFMIEGLRTDQLLIPGTELAVSQCLSALLFVGALCILIIQHKRYKGMPVTGLKTGLTKKK